MNTNTVQKQQWQALTAITILYRQSFTLIESFKTGVLDVIRKPGASIEKIQEYARIPKETVIALVDALVEIGVATYRGNKVEISDAFSDVFSDDGNYQLAKGQVLLHGSQSDVWQDIGIEDSKNEKRRADYAEKEMFESGEGLLAYLDMVRRANQDHAESVSSSIAKQINEANYNTLLDLGGGHALYTKLILEKCPSLRATIVDLEKTVETSKKLNVNDKVVETIDFVVGNALTVDYSQTPFDVIMINDVLHSFNQEQKRTTLENAKKSLAPGGSLYVTKFTHQRKQGGITNGMFSLKLNLNTGSGYLESDEELMDLIREVGGKVQESNVFHAKKTTIKVTFDEAQPH